MEISVTENDRTWSLTLQPHDTQGIERLTIHLHMNDSEDTQESPGDAPLKIEPATPSRQEEPKALLPSEEACPADEPKKEAQAQPAPRETLSTEEAGEYLHLSPKTLETMRSRGGGPPYVKLGRRVLYRKRDLEEWLASKVRLSTS